MNSKLIADYSTILLGHVWGVFTCNETVVCPAFGRASKLIAATSSKSIFSFSCSCLRVPVMRLMLTHARIARRSPAWAVSSSDETVVRPYVTYLCYMHKLGMSTCYETVVRRPDFEEELPPSSLLLAPSQKTSIFFSIIIIPTINYVVVLSFFFLSGVFFSHPMQCIFLFCTFAATIFPRIVFNRPQMFYNSAPLSFAFSFFFISLIPSQKPLCHTLTITLKTIFRHHSPAATCPSSKYANFTLVGFDWFCIW